MTLIEVEMTQDKVLKLKPIIEGILSRKYGKEVKFNELTIGGISAGTIKEEA
jgi:hypothetical protein